MYFDECYHGRNNTEIAKEWFEAKKLFSITSLVYNKNFWQLPEEISYPLAGTFASWIIGRFGISKYLEIYRNEGKFSQCIGLSSAAIDRDFAENCLRNRITCPRP